MTKLYMIVGQEYSTVESSTGGAKALVGIATSLDGASDLIGKDYMDVLVAKGSNPLSTPLHVSDYIDTVTSVEHGPFPSYSIPNYVWHIVPIDANTIINLAL
jgi:hypothetical protein